MVRAQAKGFVPHCSHCMCMQFSLDNCLRKLVIRRLYDCTKLKRNTPSFSYFFPFLCTFPFFSDSLVPFTFTRVNVIDARILYSLYWQFRKPENSLFTIGKYNDKWWWSAYLSFIIDASTFLTHDNVLWRKWGNTNLWKKKYLI